MHQRSAYLHCVVILRCSSSAYMSGTPNQTSVFHTEQETQTWSRNWKKPWHGPAVQLLWMAYWVPCKYRAGSTVLHGVQCKYRALLEFPSHRQTLATPYPNAAHRTIVTITFHIRPPSLFGVDYSSGHFAYLAYLLFTPPQLVGHLSHVCFIRIKTVYWVPLCAETTLWSLPSHRSHLSSQILTLFVLLGFYLILTHLLITRIIFFFSGACCTAPFIFLFHSH